MTPEFALQLVIGGMIAIIGFFAKRTLQRVEDKLDGLQVKQAQADVDVATLKIRVHHLEQVQ